MNFKNILLLLFIFYESVSTGPALREIGSWLEELEPEEKIREKRKVDLLQHLQNGGVGVKKVLETADEAVTAKPQDVLPPEVPIELEVEAHSREEEGSRTKKQAPDNVCIKEVGNGGKTSCGRIVSARGPGTRMLFKSDHGAYTDGQGIDHSKMDKYASMQSRTFDPLFPLGSLTSSVTYAVPTTTYTTADATATLGHTLPAIAAPAVPLAPLAPLAHIEPLSLLSHSIPIPMHPMITHRPLMNLNLQRVELPKIQEVIYAPAEIKQPAYEVKPVIASRPIAAPVVYPSRYGMVNSGFDGPVVCHPYDEKLSQQVIQIRPEVHVIEPGHKTSNSSIEEFKSQTGDGAEDDDKKVREHLRQVNEIREDIYQLNKAAQKIVEQQERLAEMQQRHLWRSGDRMSYTTPYNDLRMYMVPPTYSRASALAYPTSADDMEFFMNMLKAGKKIGTLSESFRPTSETMGVVFGGEQSGQGGNTQSSKITKQDSGNGSKTSKN